MKVKGRYVIVVLLAVCLLIPLAARADDSTAEGKAVATMAADGSGAATAPSGGKAAGEAVKAPAAPGMGEGESTTAPESEGPPPEEAAEEKPIPDPIESVNRIYFTFNDRL